MIPFRLDYVIEKAKNEGASEEQKVLKELAGVRLKPAEARAEWPRVLEHKWFMSERLGRDVGLRVAALDYFENVRLPRHTRTSHKPAASRLSGATRAHRLVA
jgi:transitional endoplasmic reticulum ATPase